jgi:hypothetical protein
MRPFARRFGKVLVCAAVWSGCADRGADLVPPTADRDPRLPQARIEVAGKSRALHLETFGDASNPAPTE